jgi:hypothetical protein
MDPGGRSEFIRDWLTPIAAEAAATGRFTYRGRNEFIRYWLLVSGFGFG